MGQRSLIALGLILVSLAGGCSKENKSTQCSSFTKMTTQVSGILNAGESVAIKSANPATTIEAFQKLAKDSADAMNQRATRIDQAVKIIQDLAVTEDQLKILKTEYLEIIQKAGSTTRSIADIYTAKSKATKETINDPSFNKQDKDLSTAVENFAAEVTQEAKLIGRLNTYCQAK
jgi:hypothetical protein